MKNKYFFLTAIVLCFFSSHAISQCPIGTVKLHNQSEVDQFKIDYPDCTKLPGSLGLCFGNQLVNLDGLSNIDSIMGSLYTGEDCGVRSLVGLENLKYIGRLSMNEAGGPENLQGLNNLIHIEGDLDLEELSGFISFEGLDNLKSIGGDFDLEDNYHLLSFAGMPKLESVGGNFIIDGNDDLTVIDGFPSLRYIGGVLEIRRNPLLTEIKSFGAAGLSINTDFELYQNLELIDIIGLMPLTNVNGLVDIRQNRKLTSLTGLDSLNADSIADLIITDCDTLSYCAVKSICDYLQIPGASFFFDLNAPDCNSGVEIATICASPTSANELSSEGRLEIYPNPTSGIINFDGISFATGEEFHLMDIHGKIVKRISMANNNKVIDISQLPSGLYFLQSNHRRTINKIVKQ